MSRSLLAPAVSPELRSALLQRGAVDPRTVRPNRARRRAIFTEARRAAKYMANLDSRRRSLIERGRQALLAKERDELREKLADLSV